MATCTNCNGAGGAYGDYASCYSCGGSGRGSHTDVACMACGGSGSSGSRSYNICRVCGGSGQVADHTIGEPVRGGRGRRGGARGARPRRAATRGDFIALAAGYAGGVVYFIHWQSLEPTLALLFAIFPAMIAALWWRGLLVLGALAMMIYLLDRFV